MKENLRDYHNETKKKKNHNETRRDLVVMFSRWRLDMFRLTDLGSIPCI